MSKRKTGVNDIIYELDNDDIEISSDDEVKQPKITRLEANGSPICIQSDPCIDISSQETIELDSSADISMVRDLQSPKENGGKQKMSEELVVIDEVTNSESPVSQEEDDSCKKTPADKTTILNEDIIVDSPASNSDLGVVGCENRTPLVTVRFKDSRLAMNYKRQIKEFMINLIKLHDVESGDFDNETDLELDIWPEDIIDQCSEEQKKLDDSLFFVDTAPCISFTDDVPRYSQNASIISNTTEVESAPTLPIRKGPICFNCEGSHPLRDCPLPRNNARINEKRKAMASVRTGRYHVEDEQKYGHLIPGRLSGALRHALGLKRKELPLHIYRMRILGYPPGWLEEARISHSGISMFDSSGRAMLDPNEEEGELNEPGSKDKFDIKKILDFPGFNVPASTRYKEEGHKVGAPPISEMDSKMKMLQVLAPNAMKAYKRKKLTFFPSAPTGAPQDGQTEMELDSGDETAEFPSIPPLPDDAPPPLPPPPPPLPPHSPPPPESPPNEDKIIELDVIEDIPIPPEDVIVIDEVGETSEPQSRRSSLSLDDLERKKQLLMAALESENKDKSEDVAIEIDEDSDDILEKPTLTDDCSKQNKNDKSNEIDVGKVENTDTIEAKKDQNTNTIEADKVKNQDTIEVDKIESTDTMVADKVETNDKEKLEENEATNTLSDAKTDNDSDVTKTPNSKGGGVKKTDYGTPILNIASSYLKLPSDDKFAKNICDVINFENLPNSTGKYKQISTLLKKVKSEVDRIQES